MDAYVELLMLCPRRLQAESRYYYRLKVHSGRKKERAHESESCEGRESAYQEGPRFQHFHGHMFRINQTSFEPCQTEEN